MKRVREAGGIRQERWLRIDGQNHLSIKWADDIQHFADS